MGGKHTQSPCDETQWQHRHEEKGNHYGFSMVSISLGNVERWALEPEIGFLLGQWTVLAGIDDSSPFPPSLEMERVKEIGHWRREDVKQHDVRSIIAETLLRPNFFP